MRFLDDMAIPHFTPRLLLLRAQPIRNASFGVLAAARRACVEPVERRCTRYSPGGSSSEPRNPISYPLSLSWRRAALWVRSTLALPNENSRTLKPRCTSTFRLTGRLMARAVAFMMQVDG